MLQRSCSLEILPFIRMETQCLWRCNDSVKRGIIKRHGGSEESFFVAFAGGALGEEGVVVRGAVDVVVGC